MMPAPRLLRDQRRQANVVAQLHHHPRRLHAVLSRLRGHHPAALHRQVAGRRLDHDRRAGGALCRGVVQNPQDIDKLDGTRINSSLPYIGKVMGSYTLPLDITLSGFYQYLSGRPYTRM